MEELLKKLVETEDKVISCDEKFIIKKIQLLNDLDLIKLNLQQKSIVFESFFLQKGTIFPIPKLNEILSVKKMYLNYINYEIKLIIEAKIDNESQYAISEENFTFSFEYKDIYKTLSNFTNIPIFENSSSYFPVNIHSNKFFLLILFFNFKFNKEFVNISMI